MALSIVISGVADPTKVPLGGSVTLTASKDASSYAWVVLSKPPGSSAPITNAMSKTCSVSLSHEGSYLIQLTINGGTLLAETATCAPAVRELETGERIPALGETTENTDWAQAAVDKTLQRVTRMQDIGAFVGKTETLLPANTVVRISGKSLIGADNRPVAVLEKALATSVAGVSGLLGVIVSAANGDTVVVGLVRVLTTGLLTGVPKGGMSPVKDKPVFVSNTGALSLTPGDVLRQIGSVANVESSTFDVALSGLGGQAIILD